MEAVICIEMLYPEFEPGEKVARIARHGFSGSAVALPDPDASLE